MPIHAYLLRHLRLIRYLLQARGRAVPFVQMQHYMLEYADIDGLQGYDKRMFQRDKLAIESNFGFVIRCKRNHGYYLAETDETLESHQRLLEAFELQEFLRVPQKLAPFVQPEARQPLGLEYLRPLLRATQARQVVELDYLKHWEAEPRRYTVGPLLLRESRGRWYVLGQMAGSGRLVCLGLDRIQQLTVTKVRFTPLPDFDPTTYFAHCFGITRPTDSEAPQQIRLKFTPMQGRYALSYPLHPSQQVETQSDREICLRLTVYDTHELRMELLSYGAEVEVLAPATLRKWLHEAHREAAEQAASMATTAP